MLLLDPVTARLNVLCVGSLSIVGRDPTVHVSRGGLSVSLTPPSRQGPGKRNATARSRWRPDSPAIGSAAITPPPQLTSSHWQIHQPTPVLHERRQWKRLGEQVTRVELGINVLHTQLALKPDLTHFEVTTVDVTRAVARLTIA